MKKILLVLILIVWLVQGCSKVQQTIQIPPQSIYDAMAKVADWQLSNPSSHPLTRWTQGAYFAGMMAFAQMSEDDKYLNALKDWGQKNNWQPGTRPYHADDHVVGQMYLEMYSLYKDPKMLEGIQERFDWILKNPSNVTLKSGQQQRKDRWWWCDALFMAPPVWAKMSALTGDRRYLDFMNEEWWATTAYLYDTRENLFFRDDTMLGKIEPNGKKIYWSRGNGWVMAGLVKVLENMPSNYPDRSKYIQLYKQMAAKLISIQDEKGFWHSSLLYPQGYPAPESSGTAFFCYAIGWGVNRGILDEATYLPAVTKAWNSLTGNVSPEGKLGYVQQIGLDPRQTTADQTEVYGVGAFLLAGCEVYKIAMRHSKPVNLVCVANPTADFHDVQSVTLQWKDLVSKNKSLTPDKVAVFDFQKNHFIAAQTIDYNDDGRIDELLFQTDLAGGQQKWFWVMDLPDVCQGTGIAGGLRGAVKTIVEK